MTTGWVRTRRSWWPTVTTMPGAALLCPASGWALAVKWRRLQAKWHVMLQQVDQTQMEQGEQGWGLWHTMLVAPLMLCGLCTWPRPKWSQLPQHVHPVPALWDSTIAPAVSFVPESCSLFPPKRKLCVLDSPRVPQNKEPEDTWGASKHWPTGFTQQELEVLSGTHAWLVGFFTSSGGQTDAQRWPFYNNCECCPRRLNYERYYLPVRIITTKYISNRSIFEGLFAVKNVLNQPGCTEEVY